MIVVLADDLTGAAEVAGVAHRYGLTVEVQLDRLRSSRCDVVVIDTNSRSCEPADAASRLRELTRQVSSFTPEFLFKKIDSVLRGPVSSELDAIRSAAGFSNVLLVCANPRKGRTTEDGRILIDGLALELTEFAGDPEYPRQACSVRQLLSLAEARIASVEPGEYRAAIEFLIGEGCCSEDLERHATTWHTRRDVSLPCGSGEFFEAVLKQYLRATGRTVSEQPLEILAMDNHALLVSGSSVARPNAWPAIRFDDKTPPPHGARLVCESLSQNSRAALQAASSYSGSPVDRLQKIVEITSQVIMTCRPQHVWIEGGRTASHLVRRLDYQSLVTVSVYGDGVVRLSVLGRSAPQLVIKPGSYPWPTISDSSIQARERT